MSPPYTLEAPFTRIISAHSLFLRLAFRIKMKVMKCFC